MDRIIRGSNWYCEEINQRLRIDETTLPELSREMSTYVAGGGFFALDLPSEIKALTSEMTVNGAHEDLRTRFGREPGDWTTITYYESLLDIFPGNNAPAPKLKGRVVYLKGLLNDYTPSGVKGLKATGATKLRWSSIVLYHDILDGKTVHKFDVQRNVLIIDGVNYTANHNRLIAA